jgi:hypothetical protein
VWGGRAVAQSADVSSDAELSKDSVNPVTRHITVPLRYQAEFQDGPYKATKSTFELDQAVVPFRLNEDWALITRTKLPGIVEPPKKHGEHWTTGLGNGYTTFLPITRARRWSLLGRGPCSVLPLSDELRARRA